MAEVKNMLHRVQHLFLSTSVSAQSCSGRWGDGGMEQRGRAGQGERRGNMGRGRREGTAEEERRGEKRSHRQR